MKRVVITGAGPVSSIGIGRSAFFAGLREGRSGIGPIASFDASTVPGAQAAEIRDFRVEEYLESRKNYLDRASELAFAAMSLALEDANLDPKSEACSSAGLLLGSAFGNLATMGLFFSDFLQKGPRLVKPVLFPHTYSNTTISLLAIEYNLAGYHANFSSGAVSSALAIVEGFDRIRLGHENLVFAGGFEAFNEILFAGCGGSCILGEGAGIVALEERDHALARGAAILGELLGAGITGGFRIGEAMSAALEGLSKPVDLVLVNGVAGKEAAALARFPDARVEALNAKTGETLGAAGALQLIAALGLMKPAAGLALVNVIDPGGSTVSLVVERLGT